MSGVIAAAAAASDWSYGGSILTFLFPMLLFIFVAGGLLVLFTKPHLVPGHRYHMNGRAVVATSAPQASAKAEAAGGEGRHAATGKGTEAK